MLVGCPCILLSERRVLREALFQVHQLRHGLTCFIRRFETNRAVASHQHTRPEFGMSAYKSLNRRGRKSALLPRGPQSPGLTPIGLACGESLSREFDPQSLAAAGLPALHQACAVRCTRRFPGRPPRRSRSRPPCAAGELSSCKPACSSLRCRIRSNTSASDATGTSARIHPVASPIDSGPTLRLALALQACGAPTVGGCSPGRRMVVLGVADPFPGLPHDRAMDRELAAVLGFRLGGGCRDAIDVSERDVRGQD